MDTRFASWPIHTVFKEARLVGVVESLEEKSTDAPTKTRRTKPGGLARWVAKQKLPFHLLHRDAPSFTPFIQSLTPDIIVVASMARRLRPEEYAIPRLGAINVHPSLLPNYRGRNPYFWQYQQLDLKGGITVHQIDNDYDTGAILAQQEVAITLGQPLNEYFENLSQAGRTILTQTLHALHNGTAKPLPQRHIPCPIPARQLIEGEQLIDWQNWNIQRIWHILHGLEDRYPLLPPPPNPKHTWRVGQIENTPSQETPGSILRDAKGHYAALQQGRIRLTSESPRTLTQKIAGRAKRTLESLFTRRV